MQENFEVVEEIFEHQNVQYQATPELQNVNFFTQSKSFLQNVTPRKARKPQQV